MLIDALSVLYAQLTCDLLAIAKFLFGTTYGCGATRLQSCPIFRFWPIFAYKTRKTYLPVTSLHPRDYIAE